jgi:DNA topoisomerase-6 subunit B
LAKITSSSTAEYFAKNLQQVGFSSPTKAVLTTLKEAVDNSLDACEENKIAPEITVEIEKIGKGGGRNTDLIRIYVEDNGPGLKPEIVPKVFGEYLASSKFGRGQCSRGQQGIGISAATTWAQLTNAAGVTVKSKTAAMRKAVQMKIDVDIKENKGLVKAKETIDWKDKKHGTATEFKIDGRLQLNGDGGLLTYLEGTALVNPHLTLNYKVHDQDWVRVERVSQEVPKVPPPTLPHPHTMKLGEFMTHALLYGNVTLKKFLRTGFSRVSDVSIQAFVKSGLNKSLLSVSLNKIKEQEFKSIFKAIQDTDLMNPSTASVLTVGEDGLANSINRLGEVDFFSVQTRKPKICDFKPVVVEVAIARFLDRGKEEDSIQLLRFANRVPLQFDKSSCAITRAVESVNWKSYGLSQSKNSLPQGPYVFAVSVTSPFIKFKNASKETIDSSDELIEEIRRALMQAGQKLSRHIKREARAADLERKKAYIEKFGPILVEGLVGIVGASEARKKKALNGLDTILGKDADSAEEALNKAQERLDKLNEQEEKKASSKSSKVKAKKADLDEKENSEQAVDDDIAQKTAKKVSKNKASKKAVSKATKKTGKKVTKKTTAKKAKKKTARKASKR